MFIAERQDCEATIRSGTQNRCYTISISQRLVGCGLKTIRFSAEDQTRSVSKGAKPLAYSSGCDLRLVSLASAKLAGIARNQIGSYLRERRRNRLVFEGETVELLATAFEQIETDKVRSLDFLQECLKRLDGRGRQLCELRYQNDLKPAAIAAIEGARP